MTGLIDTFFNLQVMLQYLPKVLEGMGVTILSDAVEARRPEDACTCLEALRAAGAHILPTETVFYAMVGDATHPQFRAFTELVKQAA